MLSLHFLILCAPVNLTIGNYAPLWTYLLDVGNSCLSAVFAFSDFLQADQLNCSDPSTFTCPFLKLSIYIYMMLSMHPCELNYWKLLIDCCLCISWFSSSRPIAVIHLPAYIYSYPFTFTWCYICTPVNFSIGNS